MQEDGNLVLYRRGTGKGLWSTRTTGSRKGAFATMQTDGNFVVYDAAQQGRVAQRHHQAGLVPGRAERRQPGRLQQGGRRRVGPHVRPGQPAAPRRHAPARSAAAVHRPPLPAGDAARREPRPLQQRGQGTVEHQDHRLPQGRVRDHADRRQLRRLRRRSARPCGTAARPRPVPSWPCRTTATW
ncbi:hypothetical protein ACFSTC_01330 [Nonomuraea ferruginea]